MSFLIRVLFTFYGRSRLCTMTRRSFLNRVSSNLMAAFTTRRGGTMADDLTETFQGIADRFNGVTVNSQVETCDITSFGSKLDNSIREWQDENRRGIWFKVHLKQSEWVPVLAKKGFRFHHAKDDFVMMFLWLPSTEDCNIPPYAHTMIGVGAVVVNENSEILVVSEKYYSTPHWKLPGGYVEPGENLVDAAIREVQEETGIKTEFHSLLTLRHTHRSMFECSDLYIVVSLRPLNSTIEKCEREISDSKWMCVDEYLNHPHVHELNRLFVEKYLEHNKHNLRIDWQHGIHQVLRRAYTVYYVTKDDNEQSSNSGGNTRNDV